MRAILIGWSGETPPRLRGMPRWAPERFLAARMSDLPRILVFGEAAFATLDPDVVARRLRTGRTWRVLLSVTVAPIDVVMRWVDYAGAQPITPERVADRLDELWLETRLLRPDAETWLASTKLALSPEDRRLVSVIAELDRPRPGTWAQAVGYHPDALSDRMSARVGYTAKAIVDSYIRFATHVLEELEPIRDEIAPALDYSDRSSLSRALRRIEASETVP